MSRPSTAAVPSFLRVGVLSPHVLVSRGVRALLERHAAARFRVVEVGADDPRHQPPHDLPDVLVVDARADVALVARWRRTPCALVVLHAPGGHPALWRGETWLPMDATGAELVRAVTGAVRQRPLDRPQVLTGDRSLDRLTVREQQVLALVAAGLLNREIAAELHLGVNTVKTYLRTAYRKIGVSRRAEATVWFHQRMSAAR